MICNFLCLKKQIDKILFYRQIYYLEKLLKIDNPVDGTTELYLYKAYNKINDSLNACKYYNKLLLLKPNLVDKNTKGCD